MAANHKRKSFVRAVSTEDEVLFGPARAATADEDETSRPAPIPSAGAPKDKALARFTVVVDRATYKRFKVMIAGSDEYSNKSDFVRQKILEALREEGD